MLIRKTTPSDVTALLAMWKRFMREHAAMEEPRRQRFYRLSQDADAQMRRLFERNIRSRNAVAFVAEEGKRPVGYLMLLVKREPAVLRIGRLGYISDLYVAERHRGMGVATLLTDAATAWAREKGLSALSLGVSPANRNARELYKKWGFLETRLELRKAL